MDACRWFKVVGGWCCELGNGERATAMAQRRYLLLLCNSGGVGPSEQTCRDNRFGSYHGCMAKASRHSPQQTGATLISKPASLLFPPGPPNDTPLP